MTPPDMRLGLYQSALSDVTGVDLVLTDPPFSETTHEGHDAGAETANKARRVKANGILDTGRPRREIRYEFWTAADVDEFIDFWVPRCCGWFAICTDSELWSAWRAAFRRAGLVTYQPVILNVPGMTVRMCGDGPSSWCIPVCVARPRHAPYSTWGTLPGSYTGTVGRRERAAIAVAGAKPLWAARALVRDYSRPGDLVVDPCTGGGTFPLAAVIEGRRAIGAEVDPETHRKAINRLRGAYAADTHNLSLFPEEAR